MSEKHFIADEKEMLSLAKEIASRTRPGILIYLQGPLGAGKTTLARGILQTLGVTDSIKSPTFTLVESYSTTQHLIFHFDLYRLTKPNEVLNIGLSDYLTEDAICLIEWPEKAGDYLPDADLYCTIEIPERGEGRWVTLR